jgi:hypothetical protein
MTSIAEGLSITYPFEFDECVEEEIALKGWLADVLVQLDNRSRYRVFFFDPVRLEQALEDNKKRGLACVAEPNMIVLSEITPTSIREAVQGLAKQGYFEHLKPLS